jgi:hypothetical protein
MHGVEVDSEDNGVESKEDDGLLDDENDDDDKDEILQAARANAPVYHLKIDAGVSLDSCATALRDLLLDKPTTDLLRTSKQPAVNPPLIRTPLRLQTHPPLISLNLLYGFSALYCIPCCKCV